MNLFTSCISELSKWTRNQCEIVDDLALHCAPVECYGAAQLAEDRRLKSILTAHGFTPTTLEYEISVRGLRKWIYQMGIYIPREEGRFVAQVLSTKGSLCTSSSSENLYVANGGQHFLPPTLPKSRGRDYDTLFRKEDWVIGTTFGLDRVLIERPGILIPEMWWSA